MYKKKSLCKCFHLQTKNSKNIGASRFWNVVLFLNQELDVVQDKVGHTCNYYYNQIAGRNPQWLLKSVIVKLQQNYNRGKELDELVQDINLLPRVSCFTEVCCPMIASEEAWNSD